MKRFLILAAAWRRKHHGLAWGVAGLLAILLAPGCTTVEKGADKVEPASRMMRHRYTFVLRGVVVEEVSLRGDTLHLALRQTPGTEGKSSFGSAAPVASDGYFLTNHHVIERELDEDLWIVMLREGGPVQERARVVWSDQEADLALLHAPVYTPDYFRWTATGEPVGRGAWILQGGFLTGVRSELGGSVGRMKRPFVPDAPGSVGSAFHYSASVRRGDSGGPVVDENGRLIGINSQWTLNGAFLRDGWRGGKGVRPNVAFLESVIAGDRVQRPGIAAQSIRARPVETHRRFPENGRQRRDAWVGGLWLVGSGQWPVAGGLAEGVCPALVEGRSERDEKCGLRPVGG
ncbi:MAG TPA: serine protease [Verrucomicrobiales bacterium]|nr:serine protease [Verrucomicrobiales bacterium]